MEHDSLPTRRLLLATKQETIKGVEAGVKVDGKGSDSGENSIKK